MLDSLINSLNVFLYGFYIKKISDYEKFTIKINESKYTKNQLKIIRDSIENAENYNIQILLEISNLIGDLPKFLYRRLKNEKFWINFKLSELQKITQIKPKNAIQMQKFICVLLNLLVKYQLNLDPRILLEITNFSINSQNLCPIMLIFMIIYSGPNKPDMLKTLEENLWKNIEATKFFLSILAAISTKNGKILRNLLSEFIFMQINEQIMQKMCQNFISILLEQNFSGSYNFLAFTHLFNIVKPFNLFEIIKNTPNIENEPKILYLFKEMLKNAELEICKENIFAEIKEIYRKIIIKSKDLDLKDKKLHDFIEITDSYILRELKILALINENKAFSIDGKTQLQKIISNWNYLPKTLHFTESELSPFLNPKPVKIPIYYILKYNFAYTKFKSEWKPGIDKQMRKIISDFCYEVFPYDFIDKNCNFANLIKSGAIKKNIGKIEENSFVKIAICNFPEISGNLFDFERKNMRILDYENLFEKFSKLLEKEPENLIKIFNYGKLNFSYKWIREIFIKIANLFTYKNPGYSLTTEYILNPILCTGFDQKFFENSIHAQILTEIFDTLVIKYRQFIEFNIPGYNIPYTNSDSIINAIVFFRFQF